MWCEAESAWVVSEALFLSSNAAQWAPVPCDVRDCALHRTVHKFPALNETDNADVVGVIVARATAQVHCRLQTLSAFVGAPENTMQLEDAVVSCTELAKGHGGATLVHTEYTDGSTTTLRVARTLCVSAERRAGNKAIEKFLRAHPACAAADFVFVSAERTIDPRGALYVEATRPVHLSACVAYELGTGALLVTVLDAPANTLARSAARAGRVRKLCEMLERAPAHGEMTLSPVTPPQLQGHVSVSSSAQVTQANPRMDSSMRSCFSSIPPSNGQSQLNTTFQSSVHLDSPLHSGVRSPSPSEPLAALPSAIPVALHPLLLTYSQTTWLRAAHREGCEVKIADTKLPVLRATSRIVCALDTLRRAAQQIAPGVSAVIAPEQAHAARLLNRFDGNCTVYAHRASGLPLLGYVAMVGEDALYVHYIARAPANRLKAAYVREHCARLVALRRMCEEGEVSFHQQEVIVTENDDKDVEALLDEKESNFVEAPTLEDELHASPFSHEPRYPLTVFREDIEPDDISGNDFSIHTSQGQSNPHSTRSAVSFAESEGERGIRQVGLAHPLATVKRSPAEHEPQESGNTSVAANWILYVHVHACRNLTGDFPLQQSMWSSSLYVIVRAGGAAARTPAVPLTGSARFNGTPLSFVVPCAENCDGDNGDLCLTVVLRTEKGRLHHVGSVSLPLSSLAGRQWTRWIALHGRGSRACGELQLTVDGWQFPTEAYTNEGSMSASEHRRSRSRRRLKSDKKKRGSRAASTATPESTRFSRASVRSLSMRENEFYEVPNGSSTTRVTDRGQSPSIRTTASRSTEQNRGNARMENYSCVVHESGDSMADEIDFCARSLSPLKKGTNPITCRNIFLRIVSIHGLCDEDGLPLCAAMCRVTLKSSKKTFAARDVPLDSLVDLNEKFEVTPAVPVRLSVIAGDILVGIADVSTEALSAYKHRTIVLVRDAGTDNATPGGFATISTETALLVAPDTSAAKTDERRDGLLLHLWSRNRRALHSHDVLVDQNPLKPCSTSGSPLCVLRVFLRRLKLPNSRKCEAKCESHEAFVRVGPHFAPVGIAALRGVLPDRDELFVMVPSVGVAVLPLTALPLGAAVTTKLPLVAAAATRDAHVAGSVVVEIALGLPDDAAAAPPEVLGETPELARVRQLLYRHDPRGLHRAACILAGHPGREEECIQALAARLGVSEETTKDETKKQMTLRILGTRGLSAAQEKCYVKVYLNGQTVLRTDDRCGCGVGSVSVSLRDPQRARLRFKVAQHHLLQSNVIAFTEMRLCGLRGDVTENVQWLPLCDTEIGKLGELGVAIASPAFPSHSKKSRSAKQSRVNGSGTGGWNAAVENRQLARVEDDVVSLLHRYNPVALQRVQALVVSARRVTRAHADLRRQLLPRVVDATVFVSVKSVRLRKPQHPAHEVEELAVMVSCGGDTASAAWPLAHALRLDIYAQDAAKGLLVAVREPRPLGTSRTLSKSCTGTTRSSSKGQKGSMMDSFDELPGVETGRAVLSLRALLTPELYDAAEAVTVPLVAFAQSPDAWLTLQQREAVGGYACERNRDVVGSITLRVRTAAFEKPPRRLRFNSNKIARHGPVDRLQIRQYEQCIAEMLAAHNTRRLVDLHHVLYERRVAPGNWESSLFVWKSALERGFEPSPSGRERSEKEVNGT